MVLLFLCYLAAGAGCAGTGSAPNLPDGWIFIAEEGVDSVPGAYHDRISGLYVRMDTDRSGELLPWALTSAAENKVSVSEHRMPRYVVSQVQLKAVKDCQDLVASLRCDVEAKASLSVSTTACNAMERERFAGLVSALAGSDWPNFSSAKVLDRADTESLVGLSWQEVRERLGRPGISEKGPKGGFRAVYEVRREKLKLDFDQNQVLRRVSK